MSAARLFWLALWTGNLLLVFTGGIWYRFGWRWALTFLIAGPLVTLGAGVVSLVLFFLVDGGIARAVPCEAGCGRLAPVQLRGKRFHRPLCDQCERQQARSPADAGQIIDEGGTWVHVGTTEERRL